MLGISGLTGTPADCKCVFSAWNSLF